MFRVGLVLCRPPHMNDPLSDSDTVMVMSAAARNLFVSILHSPKSIAKVHGFRAITSLRTRAVWPGRWTSQRPARPA